MASRPRVKRPRPQRSREVSFTMPPSKLIFVRQRQSVVQKQASDCLQLEYFGGTTIQELTYQPVFLGEAWQSKQLLGFSSQLTSSLATAMQSTDLNEVFKQYFNKNSVSAKPLASKFYFYVGPEGNADTAWKPYFYGHDIQRTIAFLHDQGALPSELKNSAVLLLLAPGTILFKRDDPVGGSVSGGFLDSMGGLASYHGFVNLDKSDRVYYAASVWSDGENGAAIPGWQPWESTCAGLYHELAEIRTNPNNQGDSPDKNWGWASCEGEEIGDLSLDWAGDDPSQVFKKDLKSLAGIPVELLWSNADKQPYAPP